MIVVNFLLSKFFPVIVLNDVGYYEISPCFFIRINLSQLATLYTMGMPLICILRKKKAKCRLMNYIFCNWLFFH